MLIHCYVSHYDMSFAIWKGKSFVNMFFYSTVLHICLCISDVPVPVWKSRKPQRNLTSSGRTGKKEEINYLFTWSKNYGKSTWNTCVRNFQDLQPWILVQLIHIHESSHQLSLQIYFMFLKKDHMCKYR